EQKIDKNGEPVFRKEPVGELKDMATNVVDVEAVVGSKEELSIGQAVYIHPESGDRTVLVSGEQLTKLQQDYKQHTEKRNLITEASVVKELKGQVEIPTTWFSTINALFIIM